MEGKSMHIEDVNGKKLVHIRPRDPNYRVLLSIDGGGIRGIIPATILKGFESCVKDVVREQEPELRHLTDDDLIVDIADCFDTIAGNSAGSMLALYFASGGASKELYGEGKPLGDLRPGSADGMLRAFDVLAKDVFTLPWRGRIPLLRRLAGVFSTKYDKKPLENGLRKAFGDLALTDLKTSTYIPAYQTDKPRPCAFWCSKVKPHVNATAGYAYLQHGSKEGTIPSMPEAEEIEGKLMPDSVPVIHEFQSVPADVPLRIVAQASSSAPTYFPKTDYSKEAMGLPVDDEERDTISWVDGAVVANNPTLHAFFFMSSIYAKPGKRVLPPSKLAVLSIGTGRALRVPNIEGGQGLLDWGVDLADVLMSAHNALNHVLMDRYFFGGTDEVKGEEPDRYIRVDTIVEEGHPDFDALEKLDDASKLPKMKDIGERTVEEYRERMKEFIRRILMA